MLSAVVAVLCRAKKLVILSDIDGFYDAAPRLYPDVKFISRIEQINESIYSLAGGTGGMQTKLRAVLFIWREKTGKWKAFRVINA